MQKNLTQNHLVLLLTENLNPEKRSEMLNSVHGDFFLQESYQELKKAYCSLIKVVKKPSDATVHNIVKYSRSSWAAASA